MTQYETSPSPVARSFAEHVRSFHASLPADEQKLLEQVFALAEQAAGKSVEVQGYGHNIHDRGENPWLTSELLDVLTNLPLGS